MPPPLPLLDLTDRMTDPDVVAVWSLASANPADLTHRARVLSFYPPAGSRRLYGLADRDLTLTTCGISQHPDDRITLHQMATHPDHRRKGLARRLLFAIFEQLNPRLVECGTDAPNDGFYRACGFVCTSEGFPPSGIERFQCALVRGET
jgi:GNAT superfamily N-acetyltransferase